VSRDGSAGITTRYGLCGGRIGVRLPVGPRIFSSPRAPNQLWGPPSLLSNCYRLFFLSGVNLPGSEADHSPPSIVEIKKS
jgi:hypothetical protein